MRIIESYHSKTDIFSLLHKLVLPHCACVPWQRLDKGRKILLVKTAWTHEATNAEI